MNWTEFDANDPLEFDVGLLETRRLEALSSADGTRQFQWLANKFFPLLPGKSIDAVYLVMLALLDFALKVMQHREDAGMSPRPQEIR
jgi:hypothetical protein